MSATYQCPQCGQIVPMMGLDEGELPHCPYCQGATRAGPPAPVSPVPDAVEAGLPPVCAAVPVPLADEEPPEIDIRRKDGPARMLVPARPGTGGARFYWILVVVGILGVRACLGFVNHRQHVIAPPRVHQRFQQPMAPPFAQPDFQLRQKQPVR